uniref:Uncharacterized protein n=1 Tax=viral metagenome TaxID=1070528 RepID=A0A6M3II40_9ZZZZ
MSTKKRLRLWIPVGVVAGLAVAAVVYAMVIQGSEGNLVSATSEGMLKTRSVVRPTQLHVNWDDAQVYSWQFNLTPSAAGANFAYFKNTGTDTMVIEKVIIAANTDETVTLSHTVTGTPATYTDTEGTNMNVGSANKADCDYFISLGMTGLSGGSVIRRWVVDGGTGSYLFEIESGIIIPKNGTVVLSAKSGSIALTGTVTGYFHE